MKNRTRRRRDRSEIAEILESYRARGLSQAAFCSELDMPLSSFSNWLRQARKESGSAASSQLVPVRVVDENPSSNVVADLEIESARGYLIPHSLSCRSFLRRSAPISARSRSTFVLARSTVRTSASGDRTRSLAVDRGTPRSSAT